LQVLREQKERSAQQRYADSLRLCEYAAARVQDASAELTTCWTTLRDKMSLGVEGTELLRARAWCNVLELKLKERAGALEQARLAVDTNWQELMRATRERETLDRFREKRKRAHDAASQREEQKMLDELAVQLIDASSPLRFTHQPAIH
jgi:flagellar export protein FliJ